jgi:hypothetical protein
MHDAPLGKRKMLLVRSLGCLGRDAGSRARICLDHCSALHLEAWTIAQLSSQTTPSVDPMWLGMGVFRCAQITHIKVV